MRPHTSEAITSEVYFIGQIIRGKKNVIKKEIAFFIEALIIDCTLKLLEYIYIKLIAPTKAMCFVESREFLFLFYFFKNVKLCAFFVDNSPDLNTDNFIIPC